MFKNWRGYKIIAFISDVLDEGFASDSVVRFCPSGEEENPEAWSVATHTKGLKKGQFKKYYHTLGKYLHIVDDSKPSNKFPKFPRVKNEARGIEELKEVITYFRSFEGYGDSHFFRNVHFKQCECGEQLSRPAHILELENIVECANYECKKEWAVSVEKDEIVWKDVTVRGDCPACGCQIPFSNTDYVDIRGKLNKRDKLFRAGEEITKNFMCLNPECSKSIELILSYSYRTKA